MKPLEGYGVPITPHRWEVPRVFNGIVSVRKYRIEIVDEPDDVIRARILELWETSANGHDRQPLREAAAKVGLGLDAMTFGKRRPRRTT